MHQRRRPKAVIVTVAVAALGVLVIVGLSQAPKIDINPKPHFSLAHARRALAGSPPALAQVHAQSTALLGGETRAFKARLASLRGTPVVVNKWAHWCGPCRAEFPFLQQAGVTFGKRVAFLGLNSGDDVAGAKAFLRRFPVPYPSYTDPKEHVAAALNASTNYPITIFYDAAGKQVTLHQGGYRHQQDLDADITRYLHPGA